MRRIISAALIFTLSGCMTPLSHHGVDLPPKRFEARGEFTATVRIVPWVQKECGEYRAIECTFVDGKYEVMMQNPCDFAGEYYAALLCHGFAHLRKNWKHEKE